MEVSRQQTDRFFMYPDYSDYAALYIETSITDLEINSNRGIIADKSESGTTLYQIILKPTSQQIYFYAPGYEEAKFDIVKLDAQDIILLRIDSRDRKTEELGTVIIRTNPAGATLRIEGKSEEFISPHTFTDIPVQKQIIIGGFPAGAEMHREVIIR